MWYWTIANFWWYTFLHGTTSYSMYVNTGPLVW